LEAVFGRCGAQPVELPGVVGAGVLARVAAAAALAHDQRARPVRRRGSLAGSQRRALAAGPRILLLDEPFTGVDVPTQELLNELFGRLAAEGRALLMTTHDLAAAARTCHRVALINRTVVAEGGPDLLADPDQMLRAFGLDRAIGAVV
jgi:manganese/iron transport system ATP-binding protein